MQGREIKTQNKSDLSYTAKFTESIYKRLIF